MKRGDYANYNARLMKREDKSNPKGRTFMRNNDFDSVAILLKPREASTNFPNLMKRTYLFPYTRSQRMKDAEGFVTRLVKKENGPLDILKERSKRSVSDYSKRLMKNQITTDYGSRIMKRFLPML